MVAKMLPHIKYAINKAQTEGHYDSLFARGKIKVLSTVQEAAVKPENKNRSFGERILSKLPAHITPLGLSYARDALSCVPEALVKL